MQRGVWANGVTDLRAFIAQITQYTLKDQIAGIRSPTLLVSAEGDPLAAAAGESASTALTVTFCWTCSAKGGQVGIPVGVPLQHARTQ